MTRITALALAATFVPLAAHAQDDRWERQAVAQINRVMSVAANAGFSTSPELSYRGQLREGTQETLRLTLDADYEHVIVATCDNDCGDIDLVVLENSGSEVAADRGIDDTPVVRVQAGHGGAHPLRVRMAQCSVDPCRYAVAVFARPRAGNGSTSGTARPFAATLPSARRF